MNGCSPGASWAIAIAFFLIGAVVSWGVSPVFREWRERRRFERLPVWNGKGPGPILTDGDEVRVKHEIERA